MDLILGSFADRHVPGFSEEELALYEEILQQNDPDLYNWISGKEEPPVNIMNPVFQKVLDHKFV